MAKAQYRRLFEKGTGRRRYVIAYNPQQAELDRINRGQILDKLSCELEILNRKNKTKAQCKLMLHRSMGRYVKWCPAARWGWNRCAAGRRTSNIGAGPRCSSVPHAIRLVSNGKSFSIKISWNKEFPALSRMRPLRNCLTFRGPLFGHTGVIGTFFGFSLAAFFR